jgi:hypothetical protein
MTSHHCNNTPLSQENKRQEMNTILQIAKKNEYPLVIIDQLNTKIKNKKYNTIHDTIQTKRYNKWITFEYHSPLIRKVTHIFRNTNLCITFLVNNTILNHLRNQKRNIDRYENSGVYSIRCNTCERKYVRQTGCNLKARFLEHHRYIKTNNPQSSYDVHISNNRHEYGPLYSTMELLKLCKKGWCMNALENYYIHWCQHKNSLIQEQDVGEINPYSHLFSQPVKICMHQTKTQLLMHNYNLNRQYTIYHRTVDNTARGMLKYIFAT